MAQLAKNDCDLEGGHCMMGGTIITTGASPAAALWLLNELTTSKCLPEGM